MNKTILAILVGLFLISSALYLTSENKTAVQEKEVVVNEEEKETAPVNAEMVSLVNCLKEKEVVIYGSKTCPFCVQLIDTFGGYDVITPIYIECTEERERCNEEKQTGYVPEIQIKGKLYEGGRSPEDIASKVGCAF